MYRWSLSPHRRTPPYPDPIWKAHIVIPHITTEEGDFAPVVFIPGDPKRAQRMVEALLTDARKATDVRGIGGYTGLYRGKPFSVMASGMDQPSFAIYATELYSFYNAGRIIRVGTMGGLAADASPGDVVIALGAYTDSSIVGGVIPRTHLSATASWNLLRAAVEVIGDDPQVKVGTVVSRDRFCGDPIEQTERLAEIDTLGVGMEATGLYTIAAELGKEALAALTIPDFLFNPSRDMTAEERESEFPKALSTAAAAVVG